jgi:hypothetical protein
MQPNAKGWNFILNAEFLVINMELSICICTLRNVCIENRAEKKNMWVRYVI